MLSREALDRIVELVLDGAQLRIINGHTYSTAQLKRISKPVAEPLCFETLTALVDYVNTKENGDQTLYALITDPFTVRLVSKLNDDERRDDYILCEPEITPYEFGQWFSQEDFLVRLQTRFAPTPAKEALTKLASAVVSDNVATSEDDGITQVVGMKAGVTLRDRGDLPPIVHLAPFRTFPEIEQPESPFLLRVRMNSTGPAFALFEADGGRWRVEAITRIRTWLRGQLPEEVAVVG